MLRVPILFARDAFALNYRVHVVSAPMTAKQTAWLSPIDVDHGGINALFEADEHVVAIDERIIVSKP